MYLDMLSALRWIKRNIRDYDGDASNVTIFGQSAGGLSVIDLGALKGSSGLYRTAISQSGLSSPGTITSYYNMSDALNYSDSIVQRMNCTKEETDKILECLRNSSIDDLIKAHDDRYTRPIIDNYLFSQYPPLAIQNGRYNNISLIMGNNDFEQAYCYLYPDMNYTIAYNRVIELVGIKWASIIANYYDLNNCTSNRDGNISRCCNIIRLISMDKTFDCDIRRIFNAFYRIYGENKLFSYHLNCYPTCPIDEFNFICKHSAELPYVFGTISDFNSKELFNCTWNNSTRKFSNEIITEWISIASTGKPLSHWSSYDPSQSKYFHITPDKTFTSEIWNRNCSFFDQIEAEKMTETRYRPV